MTSRERNLQCDSGYAPKHNALGKVGARVALVVMLVVLSSCSAEEAKVEKTSMALGEPVVTLKLDSLLSPVAIKTSSDGLIYALERQGHRVFAYDSTGRLVRSFGSKGRGPGEFTSPATLDVDDEAVYIGERSGRVHMYSLDGVYKNSVIAAGVFHMNSSLHSIADSLLVVNGLMDEASGGEYGGNLSHIVDGSSRLVKSFAPVNPTSIKYKVQTLFGNKCDVDAASSTLYCIQPTEYAINAYSYAGDLKYRTVPERVDGHRHIDKEMPENLEGPASIEWILQFDMMNSIFMLNENIAAINVSISGEGVGRIDLIDLRDGQIIAQRDVQEIPWHYDRDRQLMFFRKPVTEELYTEFDVHHVGSVFPGVDV